MLLSVERDGEPPGDVPLRLLSRPTVVTNFPHPRVSRKVAKFRRAVTQAVYDDKGTRREIATTKGNGAPKVPRRFAKAISFGLINAAPTGASNARFRSYTRCCKSRRRGDTRTRLARVVSLETRETHSITPRLSGALDLNRIFNRTPLDR